MIDYDGLAQLEWKELQAAVVRLQLDPDDMEARVQFYYLLQERVGRMICDHLEKGPEYVHYQTVEDRVFFRLFKYMAGFDRARGPLFSTIYKHVGWEVKTVLEQLGKTQDVKNTGDLTAESGKKHFKKNKKSEEAITLRPVRMEYEDLVQALGKQGQSKQPENQNEPEEKTSSGGIKLGLPQTRETGAWFELALTFCRDYRKNYRYTNKKDADINVFLFVGYYVSLLDWEQLVSLLQREARKQGWKLDSQVDVEFVKRRVKRMQKPLREFYEKNRDRYGPEEDPFPVVFEEERGEAE